MNPVLRRRRKWAIILLGTIFVQNFKFYDNFQLILGLLFLVSRNLNVVKLCPMYFENIQPFFTQSKTDFCTLSALECFNVSKRTLFLIILSSLTSLNPYHPQIPAENVNGRRRWRFGFIRNCNKENGPRPRRKNFV